MDIACFIVALLSLFFSIAVYFCGPRRNGLQSSIDMGNSIECFLRQHPDVKCIVRGRHKDSDSMLCELKGTNKDGVCFIARSGLPEEGSPFYLGIVYYRDIYSFCPDGYDVDHRPTFICRFSTRKRLPFYIMEGQSSSGDSFLYKRFLFWYKKHNTIGKKN